MIFLKNLSDITLQTVIIHKILQHSESKSKDIVTGIGLCIALFLAEFFKVILWALAWAINYRTAIRFKVALSTVAFEYLLAFKSLAHISFGEVSFHNGIL